VLFSSVACVFYICPVHYLSDSAFSLLMDEALIHKWTPNMIDHQVPRGHGDVFVNDGYPWQIKIIRGRLLYVYPWGSRCSRCRRLHCLTLLGSGLRRITNMTVIRRRECERSSAPVFVR
jgi:hypothetical protein